MSLQMSQEVVFSRESACAVHASKTIAEIYMLCWAMDLLVSFQVFERNEASSTDGADLGPRPMPPCMMAVRSQQAVSVRTPC
jgi:hypothetical protein